MDTKNLRKILIAIAAIILILAVLRVGVEIGYRQARFAGEFGNNFERNFRGPRRPDAHGAVGKIVSLNLPQLVISGPDNFEKTVLVSSTTEIRKFQNQASSTDLKMNDFVIVLGNPNNQGQIEARLIRIMPQP